MKVRIHDAVDERLAAQWNALADSVDARFSARPSYGLPWFRVLGKGELAVCAVHDGDELAAVLPLHRRMRLGVAEFRLLGHGLGTIGDVPARDARALDALVEGLHEAGVVLTLTHLPADTPLREAIRRHGGWHTDFSIDDFCPVIDLPGETTSAELRSSGSIKRSARLRRKAAKEGSPIDFAFVSDADEFESRLPDIVRTAAEAQDAEASARLNLCAPPHLEFTTEFLREEARRGRLMIWGATFGGAWGAHFIGLRRGDGSAEAWITRFSPEWSGMRPGHQLLQDICDTHALRGVDRFDFLIGRGRFKSEWQTGGYEVGTLRAAPRSKRSSKAWVSAFETASTAARTGAHRAIRWRAALGGSKADD